MKITVGIKNTKEAEFFLKNGADELYFGFKALPNNRLDKENFSSKKDVLKLLNTVSGYKKHIFIAMNDFYSEKYFSDVLKLLIELKKYGLYGAIIKDPALLSYLNDKKFDFYFILSTLSNTFNYHSVKFYKSIGKINRVVLPMQMTAENAYNFLNNNDNIETEVFCQPFYWGVNIDSSCSLPCPQTGKRKTLKFSDYPCLFKYESNKGDFYMPMPGPHYLLSTFYDYYTLGANYVKIARWPNTLRQIDLFLKVKYLLKLLNKGIKKKEFISLGLDIDSKPIYYGQSFTFKSY
ncbi:MAG: U32 family peptidase [Elusimicrobiales bacterium]|jgi:collagenase-like PrtC family protease|nr:U32 family peptidase [Elusimicrobiales bacterium]